MAIEVPRDASMPQLSAYEMPLLSSAETTRSSVAGAVALDERACAVARAVVDEDQLPFARPLLPRQSLELGADRPFAVVTREDDAELHLPSIGRRAPE